MILPYCGMGVPGIALHGPGKNRCRELGIQGDFGSAMLTMYMRRAHASDLRHTKMSILSLDLHVHQCLGRKMEHLAVELRDQSPHTWFQCYSQLCSAQSTLPIYSHWSSYVHCAMQAPSHGLVSLESSLRVRSRAMGPTIFQTSQIESPHSAKSNATAPS